MAKNKYNNEVKNTHTYVCLPVYHGGAPRSEGRVKLAPRLH